MNKLLGAFRVLIFIATTCLVANDGLRFAFSYSESQRISRYLDNSQEEEQKESSEPTSAEEQSKHKDFTPSSQLADDFVPELTSSVLHLIQDDQVRHLAYLPVFSPPPDRF